MSIIGVGAGLTPWKLAGAKPTIHRFGLPPASVHVPHGNFAGSEEVWIPIPDLDIVVSREKFMRNGIEYSSSDLTVFKARKGNELLLISVTQNGIETIGSIAGFSVHCESNVRLTGSGHRLEFHPETDYLSLSRMI